jgi:phosphoribosylformylglycinamidine synthase
LAGHDISAGGLITCLLEMTFANKAGGIEANLKEIVEKDPVKVLFAENPGVVIQVKNADLKDVEQQLDHAGVGYVEIGHPIAERVLKVKKDGRTRTFDIDTLRDIWYETSYRLDTKQSFNGMAKERFQNYKHQPIEHQFNPDFTGKLEQYGLDPDQRKKNRPTPNPSLYGGELHPDGSLPIDGEMSEGQRGSIPKAAIIREKGTNGEREMAYSLYLAGFDVKDVMMTDLVSGRETLEDINMIVFCGGFSNSDVLGSAKGWAGAFLFNPKAKAALDAFYAREDTLSLGICNGCQLMVELGLVNNEAVAKEKLLDANRLVDYKHHYAQMLYNVSHKFESEFVTLQIPENHSVMFGSLSGNKLGIWVAHGEGNFSLPKAESEYHIVAKYNYTGYPANPNGSTYDVAGICSADGRHLAMMPHLERAIFPWQQAHYPADRCKDEITPWMEAFVNARKWIERNSK